MKAVPPDDEPEEPDPTRLVADGYDRVSGRYTELASRPSAVRDRFTELVLDRLPEGSRVLDLGCGSGTPTTARLAARFSMTGVDLSAVQVAHAREAVPGGRFIRGDMSRIQFRADSFDAVVAFFSIIHVPRDRQAPLFRSVRSWLRPAGLFVATLASRESEACIEDDFLGSRMYWSSFAPTPTRRLIEDAGLEVESAGIVSDVFDGEDESHFWVVASCPSK